MNLTLFEPTSSWRPPSIFPNVPRGARISIDLETKDPLLDTRGPGTIRKDGFPAGIALGLEDWAGYYPMRHMMGGNMDPDVVLSYFTDLLKRTDLEVVFAHGLYDLEWLKFDEVKVNGKLKDILINEPLIDEESSFQYNVSGLGQKYLGHKKDEKLLNEAASAFGVDPKAGLWKLHPRYVGQYAEMDVRMNLEIFKKQEPIIKELNLQRIVDMETDLIPILLDMRGHGVRVDLERAAVLGKQWLKDEEALLVEIRKIAGCFLDIWSGDMIQRVCDRLDISYPKTAKGNASFSKVVLEHSQEPLLQLIRKARSINRLRKTYVEELMKFAVNGRIHAEFHPLRGDEDGTRTGRFSSSCPNLQQIPSRDKVLAPIIRSLFLPDEGEEWNKYDYSQQEPRVLTHYAHICKLRGADKMQQEYVNNPKVKFYDLAAREARLEYSASKILTLGICYGEGMDKIAVDLAVSVEEARRLMATFNQANPYVKDLSEQVMQKAKSKGCIISLLGRRFNFNLWEPAGSHGTDRMALRLEAAQKMWPDKRLVRAYTYKALNRLIQGSSADMTKAAMIGVYKERKRFPLSQVHDELNYSLPRGDREESAKIKHILEHCVPLTVPIVADLHIGEHWK